MSEIRQIIREELRKMRLNERKEGHDIVMKVAKLVRDAYVRDLTKHLVKNNRSSIDGFYGVVRRSDIKKIYPNVYYNIGLEIESDNSNVKGSYNYVDSIISITFNSVVMKEFLTSSAIQGINLASKVKSLVDTRWSTIVHEVQHWYDATRDFQFGGKRAENYSTDDAMLYFTHPSEINAFFTQVASTIPLAIRGWDDVEFEFFSNDVIRTVIRYNGDKIRKYYLKRLYTLWSKTNKAMNLEPKGKNLTRKIDKISDELAARYPEQLPMLDYSHTDNVIYLPMLLAPTIKDEIEIHKNIIRLADKYRKMIAVDETDPRLDTKEQNARIKYLKKLGYKLNRNKEILFGTMYIRNPKR